MNERITTWIKGSQAGRILYYISPVGWSNDIANNLISIFTKKPSDRKGAGFAVWLVLVMVIAFFSIRIYKKLFTK